MTDERYTPTTSAEDTDPETEQLVAEIEITRSQMGGTIDEIGHRLQPQTIASQARDQLREATVGRVERIVDDAGQTAQRTSNSIVETIRENPLPAALAALGIGWLALRFREQQASGNGTRHGDGYGYRYGGGGERYAYEPERGGRTDEIRQQADRFAGTAQGAADRAARRAQQVGADAQETAQEVMDRAQEGVYQAQSQLQGTMSQAQRQFDSTMRENPLAMGALAFGVGAAVGLAIPETRQEQELMGEQRDRLMEQAESAVSQALDEAEQKSDEVASQVESQG